jgi:CAAD domains of cyanobacterial aminoacyl-tRNA synthetase
MFLKLLNFQSSKGEKARLAVRCFKPGIPMCSQCLSANPSDVLLQLPKLLELVGLGYTAWFVYRYLLFKVKPPLHLVFAELQTSSSLRVTSALPAL